MSDGLNNLRDVLRKDTALVRTEILKHTSEITMIPQREAKHRHCVAEGNWDLLGSDSNLARGSQYHNWRPRMVAGGCNASKPPSWLCLSVTPSPMPRQHEMNNWLTNKR